MSQAMVQPTQHQGGLDVQMQNCTTASLHWGLPQCEAIHMHTYVRTYVCRFIHSYIHSYIQCHQISYVSKYFSIDHGLRRPTIFSLDSPFTPAEAKRLLYIYIYNYIYIYIYLYIVFHVLKFDEDCINEYFLVPFARATIYHLDSFGISLG